MKFTLKWINAALVWEQENSQSVPGIVPWGLKADMAIESSAQAEQVYYQIITLNYSENRVLELLDSNSLKATGELWILKE